MAPLQHPQGRTPRLCPGSGNQALPDTTKTPILHTFAKVSLKNEFSLGTHQAGWVPTWSLYNTHGLAPLTFDPFLGYTGVKPFIQQ